MLMNLNYRMMISPIETTSGMEYEASFPDVPGAVGGGRTPEEAVKDAYATLEAHLQYMKEDGEEIPQPSLTEEEYSGKLQLRISKSLHKRAKQVANWEGVSMNALINEALTTRVTQLEDKKIEQALRQKKC